MAVYDLSRSELRGSLESSWSAFDKTGVDAIMKKLNVDGAFGPTGTAKASVDIDPAGGSVSVSAEAIKITGGGPTTISSIPSSVSAVIIDNPISSDVTLGGNKSVVVLAGAADDALTIAGSPSDTVYMGNDTVNAG